MVTEKDPVKASQKGKHGKGRRKRRRGRRCRRKSE
jgi:hypothetical protein